MKQKKNRLFEMGILALLFLMISCRADRLPVGRYEAKVWKKSVFSGEAPYSTLHRINVSRGNLVRYEYRSELLDEPTITERKMLFEKDRFLDSVSRIVEMKYDRKNKTITLPPVPFIRRDEVVLQKVK